jgi:hypothetical protein
VCGHRAEQLLDDAALDGLCGGVVDLERSHLTDAAQPVGAAVVARAEQHELIEPAVQPILDPVVDLAGTRDS